MCVCVCVRVRVRVRVRACVRAAGYQPRPQVVDRGMTTRYGGQLQLRYKRVSSPDEQAAANHAATESPERGGGLAGGAAHCHQVSAHALRRLCDMASLSRHSAKLSVPHCLVSGRWVSPKAKGDHPNSNHGICSKP